MFNIYEYFEENRYGKNVYDVKIREEDNPYHRHINLPDPTKRPVAEVLHYYCCTFN